MKLTGLCRWSQVALGASVCGPGPLLDLCCLSWDKCWRSGAALGPRRAVLGHPWGLYRRSWLHLGSSWGLCRRSWAALEPLLAVLARSWGCCVSSWAALEAYVGGLGPLLGPMLAVLGRSWGLGGRSGDEKREEHDYLENVDIS